MYQNVHNLLFIHVLTVVAWAQTFQSAQSTELAIAGLASYCETVVSLLKKQLSNECPGRQTISQ